MPAIRCPRCDSITFADRAGTTCERCGEKLPAPDAIGTEPLDVPPVRVGRPLDDIPDYLDVRKREDPREERRKKAASEVSGMLIAIALLTIVCNGINLYLNRNAAWNATVTVAAGLVVSTVAAFVGLGVWARWMPIPAGIIGVILYVGLAALEVAVAASAGGVGFPRGLILKAFISIALIRGVYSAIRAS